jgi:transcriptional regulator
VIANEKLGVLRGHLARANGQVADLRGEHGKVVPTWNYTVLQARGKPKVIEDPAWLLAQIGELTNQQEKPRPHPWKVSDAPEAYVAAQLKAIIGIEIEIDRLEGKWNVSQNRPEDRLGVAEGLSKENGDDAMAELVANRGPIAPASTER